MDQEVVLLFSGQGAQKVGMGKDLVEGSATCRALLEEAEGVLGWPLGEVMFGGPIEELTRTARCQPALYVHGFMLYTLLRERVPGLPVVAAAGLSLGEFTAHAAAGTLSFAEGLRVVARRGEFMEEACNASKGAMTAVIGGDEAAIRKLAEACDVDVANLNAPGQIVLSGSEEGIDRATAGAKEAGAKLAKKLVVAGAYHSRLMKPAQGKLAAVLERVDFAQPSVPVWSNFTARPAETPEEIRDALTRQVTGSVRWAESMADIVGRGHGLFIELGPDKALAGMMKRIAREAEVRSAATLEELGAVVG